MYIEHLNLPIKELNLNTFLPIKKAILSIQKNKDSFDLFLE